MKLRSTLVVAGTIAGVLVSAVAASAATPQRFNDFEQVNEVVGTCPGGDQLVGDWTVEQTVTWFSTGTGTLHLQLAGTITRTGTGVVGRYSERQRDFGYIDGSERYVGLLGQLVVPGGTGFTFAGQARLSPDGTLATTPGLATLDDDFEATLCDALAR